MLVVVLVVIAVLLVVIAVLLVVIAVLLVVIAVAVVAVARVSTDIDVDVEEDTRADLLHETRAALCADGALWTVVKREGERNIGVFVRDVLCCCAVLRLGGRTGRDQQ